MKGIFIAPCKKKILFTKKIRVKTSELPRWKPKIILGKEKCPNT